MNGDHRSMPGDEMIIRGLMRKGWVEAAARKYVAEAAGRRRSRSGSGEGSSLSSPEGLNSSQEVAPFHASNHGTERNGCPLNRRAIR